MVTTASTILAVFRKVAVDILFAGLRFYTKHAPYKRGRGIFIGAIDLLQRRGWPAPLTRIGNGLVMEFEPSLLGWTTFERGEWEPEQTAAILKFLRPGAIVLNIGANTGYYALLAAGVVGTSRGHVHAFEIQPQIVDILHRNVALNGFEDVITIVEAGCFSTNGNAAIEPHGDPGSARITLAGEGVRVPLITLDHYVVAKALDHVELIVIDAEGSDFEVLKGAVDVLARFRPPVLAEAHHLAAFGGSEDEMCTFMSQFGYSVHALQGEFSRDVLFLPPMFAANGLNRPRVERP
jgi:FkbM family methyltransferase